MSEFSASCVARALASRDAGDREQAARILREAQQELAMRERELEAQREVFAAWGVYDALVSYQLAWTEYFADKAKVEQALDALRPAD